MKSDFRITWYESLDSTQNEVRRLLDTLDNMDVIAAGYQTDGKGQRGNRWLSEPWDNLMFSFPFRPQSKSLHVRQQFYISIACTLGVNDFLSRYGIVSKIKWPNDIYVRNKKICGMLIENILDNEYIGTSIIGIGVNVNQTAFSPQLINPTSMASILSKTFDVKSLLIELLSFIKSRLDMLSTPQGMNSLRESYLDNLYAYNSTREYRDCLEDKIFAGKITGITEAGLLIVESEDGTKKEFGFKQISYII